MREIDGSFGEGGGQLLRTAVALAAITGQAVRINNIRARRSNPGLAPQHLTAVKAVAALCDAQVDGLQVKAQEILFRPGPLKSGHFRFDVGTAGSITLVVQAVLPAALAAGGETAMHITGGTDVRAAPPLDYLRYVSSPLLARMGVEVTLTAVRRGYYPRGGGEVDVTVRARHGLRPVLLDSPGELRQISGAAHVANLPGHITARMVQAAGEALRSFPTPRIEETLLGWPEAIGQGGAIVLWATCVNTVLGAAATAQRGIPAERLGEDAGRAMAEEISSGATLDFHAADQLLVYLALAKGHSCFLARSLSSHATTTMWLAEQFLPVRFTVKEIDRLVRVDVRPHAK
jgi:RNA 3'-terminal phosphate cyclase (ATP)/RNA 3'-terminal phosphate cyclase (GTP)